MHLLSVEYQCFHLEKKSYQWAVTLVVQQDVMDDVEHNVVAIVLEAVKQFVVMIVHLHAAKTV